jgi:protocatechuate 3,4-dioxygenase beta subunit
MRLTVLALAAIALTGAASSYTQTTAGAQQPCTLSGTVVDAVSGQPLRDSSVTARGVSRWEGSNSGGGSSSAPSTAATVTDASGRFSFDNLAPGRYMISASHDGYVSQGFGRRGFQPLALAPGGRLDDVVLRLAPGATISGRIVNSQNKALPKVGVEALRQVYRSGRSEFVSVKETLTDEAGEYQLTALVPGKYYLRAIPPQSQAKDSKSSYVPTYFPATTGQSGSTALSLRAGEQMAGVAITLSPTHTVIVSGRVVAPAKSAAGQSELTVVGQGSISPWPYDTTVDEKGKFELPGIPAGIYVLIVHRSAHSDQERPIWGKKTFEAADTDLRNVEVAIGPGVEVSGRITLDEKDEKDAKPDIDLSQLTADLEPVHDSVEPGFTPEKGNTSINSDGTFTFHDIPPGNYRILFFRPPGGNYYMKSAHSPNALETGIAVFVGQPVRNLDFVLTSGGAHVDGTVEQDQLPAAGVQVVLVPDGARRAQPSYFRGSLTDNQGRFTLESIPPGDYKLFAWQAMERGAYLDPEFLQQFEDLGKAVSLKEGESMSVQLDAIPAE